MDDLSDKLKNANAGCHFNGYSMNHLFYADDSCLLAPSPAGLQSLVDICVDYSIGNTLIYNKTKSKCMCFKPSKRKNLYLPNIWLNDKILEYVETFKYLGVFISNSSKDLDDMLRHRGYIYSRGNFLINRFMSCTNTVKQHLFKTFLFNMYGSQLWCNFTKCALQKLKVAYNNVFRKFFNIECAPSISEIFVQNNINSFNVILRKTYYQFRARLFKSHNSLISTIVNFVFFYYHSSFTRLWNEYLFNF